MTMNSSQMCCLYLLSDFLNSYHLMDFLRYSLYFIAIFLFIKKLKILLKRDKILMFLLAPFLIFLIDSFFNFPHDRPVILILTQIFISIFFLKSDKVKFFKSYTLKKPIIIIIFLLCIPSSYLAYLTYRSYVYQNHLVVGMIQDSYFCEDEVYNINLISIDKTLNTNGYL